MQSIWIILDELVPTVFGSLSATHEKADKITIIRDLKVSHIFKTSIRLVNWADTKKIFCK